MSENTFTNTLIYGDNLEILKSLSVDKDFFVQTNGGIDLIYIDPPFNSNRNYNMPFEDMLKEIDEKDKYKAQKEAFNDTWSNIEYRQELEELRGCVDCIQLYNFLHSNEKVFSFPQMSYLTMMAHRIYYMHKVLKDTGSFYLHCDPTMGHYLKILLDMVFGLKNFRNEITWKRTRVHKSTTKNFPKNSDTIFYYCKSDNFIFNQQYAGLSKEYIKKSYIYDDNDGRGKYLPVVLTGPNVNSNDKEWKGYHPSKKGRSWSVPKVLVNKLVGEEKAKTMSIYERLDLLYENGYIEISKNGTPKYKRHLELSSEKGTMIDNMWADIISCQGNERMGYPTQKPLALLERIIKASSSEGDVVADFFCGCGTTIAAAEQLNRKWLGVDINHLAIAMVEEERIKPIIETKEHKTKYKLIGFPKDMASAEKLAKDNKYKFEQWIVEYVFKGHQTKRTGDKGIDGYIAYNFHNANNKSIKKMLAIMEVKGGNVNIAQIRAFKNSIENDFKADFGLFIAFDKYITDGMRQEANALGFVNMDDLDVPNLQFFKLKRMYIITIDDILKEILPQELQQIVKNITY